MACTAPEDELELELEELLEVDELEEVEELLELLELDELLLEEVEELDELELVSPPPQPVEVSKQINVNPTRVLVAVPYFIIVYLRWETGLRFGCKIGLTIVLYDIYISAAPYGLSEMEHANLSNYQVYYFLPLLPGTTSWPGGKGANSVIATECGNCDLG